MHAAQFSFLLLGRAHVNKLTIVRYTQAIHRKTTVQPCQGNSRSQLLFTRFPTRKIEVIRRLCMYEIRKAF